MSRLILSVLAGFGVFGVWGMLGIGTPSDLVFEGVSFPVKMIVAGVVGYYTHKRIGDK